MPGTPAPYFTRPRRATTITNNSCNPNGPRGAANAANLQRQRDKIVSAINTADADIVSLEELENSVKFGKNRDFAINELVNALNADAGAGHVGRGPVADSTAARRPRSRTSSATASSTSPPTSRSSVSRSC